MKKELTGADLKINKPEPIKPGAELACFNQETDIQETIATLLSGKNVIIEGYYSNGLILLNELQSYLRKKHPSQGFQEQ